MPTGAALMIFVSIFVGLAGMAFSSQASAGPAIVGFACLLAIYGRMMQASAYEREWIKRYDERIKTESVSVKEFGVSRTEPPP